MNVLALVLVGDRVVGSLAAGARMAGVYTVAAAVCAPWRARRLDRGELRRGLRREAVLAGGLMALLAMLVATRAPVPALVGAAGLAGAATGALPGAFRALLPAVVPAQRLGSAYALDAVLVEVAFIAGPALAGGIALFVGPVETLGFVTAALGVSVAVMSRLPLRSAPPRDRGNTAPPWRSATLLTVYALAGCVGMALGMVETTTPARVAELGGRAASAGFLLALYAVGSAVGGLAAARARFTRPISTGLALLAAVGVLLLPLAILPTTLGLGVALAVAGLPLAPLNALASGVTQRHVAPARRVEGFSLTLSCLLLGAGLGSLVTGALLDAFGPSVLLLIAGAVPLAGAGAAAAGVAWARRRPVSAASP